MTPAAELRTLAGIAVILFAASLPWSALLVAMALGGRRKERTP